ncbi:uncharacterized protein LOC105914730 [Setaria italica]|uniref:uncharacterized protein LOC105914730 n=1 Tax=Setaria italica TaxID=4555 RepID=UPI000647BDF3|nr:uncharacterized protein LOC105914730 [Setaria italica]
MAAYCNEVRKLEDKFDGLELNHVARRFNEAADELAKAASGRMPVPDGVFISDQSKPSIRYLDPAGVGEAPPALGSGPEPGEVGDSPPVPDPSPPIDWRAPYLDYLVRGTLPADKTEARRIARRAKSFTIIDQELYKRSHTGILQRCIPVEQGKALIQDIHAGACGHHAAPRTLVGNAFRQGFYWPTAVADATQVVRTCEGCQFFAHQTHLPAQALQTIPITWPFAVWGLDLFTGKRFLQFCDDHHIRVDWEAVAHPRTNGQVERANGMILQGLKPRIFDRLKKFGGRWVAELPAFLWSLRTTPSQVADACALYKSEDEHQKAFQFMHCWNKLRTQPKWLSKIDELAIAKTSNKKQETSSTTDPSASLPNEIIQGEVQAIEHNALTRLIVLSFMLFIVKLSWDVGSDQEKTSLLQFIA